MVVVGAGCVVVVATTVVVTGGSTTVVSVGSMDVVTLYPWELTSSFVFSIPFASGERIAILATNATRITGFEYFNFKSFLLDGG